MFDPKAFAKYLVAEYWTIPQFDNAIVTQFAALCSETITLQRCYYNCDNGMLQYWDNDGGYSEVICGCSNGIHVITS